MDNQQILILEQQLLEAIKTGNIAFLNNILHDDLRFLTPDGQVITKQMDLASHRAGSMVVEEVIPTIEDIRTMEDTAVVVLTYDTKGTMMGTTIEGTFRYIRVWKRFGDGFKVIAGSCLKV